MSNIEVEVRSFISKKQYQELMEFFKDKAELIKKDNQETFYFDCEQDLRIQRNNFFSKIWLKKGRIHDHHREEIEIKFSRKDFEKLEKLFLTLGYKVQIKWFRKRFMFNWNGTSACLDFTKGYGYIIELEKKASPDNQEAVYVKLTEKLKSLNVKITPKEEFEKKYQHYKKNWKRLIKN